MWILMRIKPDDAFGMSIIKTTAALILGAFLVGIAAASFVLLLWAPRLLR